jgi:hypothetical protein
VAKPDGKNIIRVKWIFKTKRNELNEIVRFKVRLVAKGFTQEEGRDYFDVYALVAKITTIRVVLALAAKDDLELDSMDVKTAFLQAGVEEEIYVYPPKGHEERGPDGKAKVWRLKKSLYGLKQAPRNWNKEINAWFLDYGFKASAVDPCLNVRHGPNGSILIVILYVDDLIIAGSSRAEVDQFKKDIAKRFDMSDLGALKFFLGMEICRDRIKRTLDVKQTAYVDRVLERYGMDKCKPVASPAEGVVPKISTDEGGPDKHYMSAVGSIIYATMTRPDLSFTVCALGRHFQATGPQHWAALKRALRYMKGTREKGLRYGGVEDDGLKIFADADWAGNPDNRRSTTGCVVMLNGGPVSYTSKEQPTVALSSTEAEYMSACAATQEAIYLRVLLKDLGYEQNGPTTIMEDNQGCIAMTENPIIHKRSKHIDIKYHFTRERVEMGEVRLEYVATEHQLADMMTKALQPKCLAVLRDMILRCG